MIKQTSRGSWFYIGIILLIVTILVLAYTFFRLVYAFSSTSTTRISTDKTSSQQTTQQSTPAKTQTTSTAYQDVPFYSDSTEIDFQQTKGEGIDATYETPKGVTTKQLMDFYEEKLKSQDWQITLRDRDNKQLEALAKDGTKLRIWVYFAGGEDAGISFNVNYRPPGSEAWLPIPVQ